MDPTLADDAPPIDAALVSGLIRDQFPDWADLPVRPVLEDGHDNRSFRLGDTKTVRVPSHRAYAAHLEVEHRWLPRVAPALPLDIPEPLAFGAPGRGLPWRWLVNRWLPGSNAEPEAIDNLVRLAESIGEFLVALQSVDATGGPAPGRHNFYRGGALEVYEAEARACATKLAGALDLQRTTKLLDVALGSTWSRAPVWIHGDTAPDNMLVEAGRLTGVIDFGQMAAGDPACDLTIAWTLFSGDSRAAFVRALDLDEATWQRSRAWCLWKAMLQVIEFESDDPQRSAKALAVARDVLAD